MSEPEKCIKRVKLHGLVCMSQEDYDRLPQAAPPECQGSCYLRILFEDGHIVLECQGICPGDRECCFVFDPQGKTMLLHCACQQGPSG